MVLLSLFILLCAQSTNAYDITGEIMQDKPWTFLDKFCFNPANTEAPGVFTFDFVYPANSTMVLLVYWYADSQWKSVYSAGNSLTCQEKVAKAQKVGNRFDIYSSHWKVDEPNPNPRNMYSSKLEQMESDGIELTQSKGQLTFASGRERWYYFALANCDPKCAGKKPNHCNGEIRTTYSLTFSNGEGWDKGVSADLQGLAESSIVLFVFWLCIACCVLTFQLASMSRRRMLHSTVKLLTQALVWHIAELFFATVYFTNNVDTGKPSRGLRIIYRVCSAISETEIVLLLILLAKGWTVVRRKISAQGRVRITAFITIYACVQFAVVTWEATVGADPADITYLYESPPGFVLMCMRLYALIWFLRAILITRLKYTRKRGFYWKFAVLGGLWMIALPFQVGLANLVIAVHLRPKFVFAFSIVLNVIFFLVMFFLFSPSRFNRAFPFHAKTSDMEARAPASTSWGPSGRGGAAQQNGVARTSASGGTPQSGGVEMTPNGPIFRSRPNAASGGTGRTDLSSRGSATMSGGLAMGTPEERVRFSIQKIRTKITQLADHSDDLEYALDEMDLHEWDSPNVKDADYDLPDARGGGGGGGGGGRVDSGSSSGANTASSGNQKPKSSGTPGKSKRPRPAPPSMDD